MSGHKRRYLAMVGLLVLSWTAPAQAVVCQWVDGNGTRQFSIKKPLNKCLMPRKHELSESEFSPSLNRIATSQQMSSHLALVI